MEKFKLHLILLISGLVLASCAVTKTRVEEDLYTISERDTVYKHFVQNDPGNNANGVVYPSSRVFQSERTLVQRDSLVTRYYPDFIRLGFFESAGLIGTSADRGLGVGLFGLFPDYDKIKDTYTGQKSTLFSGGMYRIGIGEWRLRWFRDAKNWTYGTYIAEIIAPNAQTENTLFSIAPLYIRKRFYFKETIPYIAATPYFGIGWYPSQYINLGGSFDVGSIGGLNIRAYLGLATGMNPTYSPQIRSSIKEKVTTSVTVPYAGIGVSVLDFLNLVPETEKEWKYHEHSSWNIGLFQIGMIKTAVDTSVWYVPKDSVVKKFVDGMILKIANASVALPVLNNKFYLGTSLANFVILGYKEWGIGVLPIRLGYFQTVLEDELTTEPFLEYNYYPSGFFHIGNRLNLRLGENFNVSLVLGYASGSASKNFGRDITTAFGESTAFSRAYIGLSFGIMDKIFYPGELRYYR